MGGLYFRKIFKVPHMGDLGGKKLLSLNLWTFFLSKKKIIAEIG